MTSRNLCAKCLKSNTINFTNEKICSICKIAFCQNHLMANKQICEECLEYLHLAKFVEENYLNRLNNWTHENLPEKILELLMLKNSILYHSTQGLLVYKYILASFYSSSRNPSSSPSSSS
jgi:hypothetical protein